MYENEGLVLDVPVSWEQETVWLTRQQMADLYGRDIKTIGKHINNALREELDSAVVAKFATTASDGKVYQTEHYNLDMIISVGYRVKSVKGIIFRKWANSVLKQYLVNGYAITLMIAESNPKEKDIMVKLVMNLLDLKTT